MTKRPSKTTKARPKFTDSIAATSVEWDIIDQAFHEAAQEMAKLVQEILDRNPTNNVAALREIQAMSWETIFTPIVTNAIAKAGTSVLTESARREVARLGFTGFDTARDIDAFGAQALMRRANATSIAITRGSKDAITRMLANGFRDGTDIRKIAKEIEKVIGLTERHANAINNMRLTLERDGVAESEIERLTDKRAKKLRKYRAMTIARTETIHARTAAQLVTWEAGIRDGFIKSSAQKKWLASVVGTCPICVNLRSRPPQPLRQPYDTITGALIQGPPSHPRCRCSLVLVGT